MPFTEISETNPDTAVYTISVQSDLPGDTTGASLYADLQVTILNGSGYPDWENMDAWFQSLVDAIAGASGITLATGYKGYGGVSQACTPTPPE